MLKNFLIVLLLGLFIIPPTVSALTFPRPSFISFPSFPTSSSTPKPSCTPNPSGSDLQLIDPSTVNFSQEFTLKGKNLGSSPGSVNFYTRGNSFILATAPIISWSDTEIKATLPSGIEGGNYYDVAVKKVDNSSTNRLRVRVKYGEPLIEATSISNRDGEITITLSGEDFNSRDGKIIFYNLSNLVVGEGEISSWTNSRIRFQPPALPSGDYLYQIHTFDGRKGILKSLNL